MNHFWMLIAAQEETFSDDDELRALNGQERKTGKALPKRLTGHQKQIMEKLIAKHGDDCKVWEPRLEYLYW